MTGAEQVAIPVVCGLPSAVAVHLWKERRRQAKRGQQQEEHLGLVTKEELDARCGQCRQTSEKARQDGQDATCRISQQDLARVEVGGVTYPVILAGQPEFKACRNL